MKKTLVASLIAASFTMVGATASADTGTINFQGEITNSACSLGGGQLGTNMIVPLGSISTNQFAAVGDQGPKVDFTISLLGCDTSVLQTVSISFQPAAGSVVPTGLLSLESGGGAQGVAIGIDGPSGTPVVVGGAAIPFALVSGTNNLNFKAYYEAVDATVTAGPANGRATFELTYS